MRGMKGLIGAAVALLLSSGVTNADSVTFIGGPSGAYSASITFSHTAGSNQLIAVIDNNGSSGDGSAAYLVGAVFFTSSTSLSTPISAMGADIYNFSTNTDLGSQSIANDWAFKGGISGNTLGFSGSAASKSYYGLSGVGYNVFGSGDIIGDAGSSTAGGGTPPDGPAMMIAPANFTPNGGMTSGSNNPLVVEEATFTFNVSTNFDLSTLGSVTFQYGTSLSENQLTGSPGPTPSPGPGPGAAPLPSTAYAGFGLLGLVGLLRLRKGRRIVAA